MVPLKRSLPFLLFLLLTVGMTLPVAFHLRDSAFISWDDTAYCIWARGWNFHKLEADPAGLFDANIFYPYRNTLAFSENLIGPALVAWPLYLLTGETILCHQFLLLLSFFLSAVGAYLLGFHLTGDRRAAFLSGTAFAFCQYRFGNLHLLSELSTQWIPFCLFYMHKFLEDYRSRHLFACLFFYLLNFLSCLYYGVILSLFLAPTFLYLAGKGRSARGPLPWPRVTPFVVAGALALVPILRPYAEVSSSVGGDPSFLETVQLSPDLVHLLAPSPFQWALRAVTERVSSLPEGE